MLRTRRPGVRLPSARPVTGCKSAARQPASDAGSRWFESIHPDQFSEMWPSGRRRRPAKTEASHKRRPLVRIQPSPPRNASLAQLVEHPPYKRDVGGSNPTRTHQCCRHVGIGRRGLVSTRVAAEIQTEESARTHLPVRPRLTTPDHFAGIAQTEERLHRKQRVACSTQAVGSRFAQMAELAYARA